MSSRTQIQIGSEFVGYRLDELIGRGGMGVVYRAYDLRLKRSVALKLMAPELALDQRFRERFSREAELAMSLEHPNVVPIHDAGEIDGRLYLAMRRVEGTDLRALLHVEGVLDPARALAICSQVANALDAAHASGLVHRDVKPSNVLLDANEHVYLADFGLTRQFDEHGGPAGEGRSVGTPAYLAPEQIEGGPLDGRSDVYSLGCLLYECLTGEVPFSRGSRLAVAWAHLEEEPPSASERRPELPVSIDAVIRKAMAKEARDRYPTCAALINAAAQALGLGRPPTVRRHRLLVIAAVAIVLLLAAALVAALIVRGTGSGVGPTVNADTLARIDPATNKIDAVVDVGLTPSATAVSGRYIWVYNYAGSSVTEIDAATRHVLQTTTATTSPTDLSPFAGPVLAADRGGGWLIGVDQRGRFHLTRVLSGGGRRDYRLEQRPLAVAVGYDAVWVVTRGAHDNQLLRVDPTTGQITQRARFPASSAIDGLTTGLGSVWGVASSTAVLYRINPHSVRITKRTDLGEHATRPEVVLGSIWVGLSDGGGNTAVVNPRTLRFEDLGCCPPAQDIGTVENGSLWTYDAADGIVVRWDPQTYRQVATVHVTDPPFYGGLCLNSIAAGDGAVWVTLAGAVGYHC